MTTENTNDTQAPAPVDYDSMSVEEYAAAREAEAKGEKPVHKSAAAVDSTAAAGAAEDSAASTEGDQVDGKTASESATEDDQATQETQAPKGKKGIEKRFSELTAEKKAAEALAAQRAAEVEAAKREAEQAKAEAERLRLEAERAQNAIPQVPNAEDDPAPNRMDYDDPDEYAAALSAHVARQEVRKAALKAKADAEARAEEARQKAEEARRTEAQRQINQLHSKFQQRQAEVKPEYPDYDEKVTNNESLTLRNDVFFVIEQTPDAPHILYHIASNPDVAESLNKLSPVEAAIRIGELQGELRTARKPKVSKAAEPIRPVGNRSSPLPKSPDEMTAEEYAAHVKQKEAAAGKNPSRVRLI